jgi:hypothetical protein
MAKIGIFTFYAGLKNSPENVFYSFLTKNDCYNHSCQNLEKKSHAKAHTLLKMKIFELFKNKNKSSNIFTPTGYTQFLSLAFKNCAASIEKCHFFQEKAKKSKIPNSVQIEKKYFGKKFFHEVLIFIGRVNYPKFSQIGDGHWSLGRFLPKPLLSCFLW